MLRTALVFGAISGFITVCTILISMNIGDGKHAFNSELLGYLIMIVALSMIFFGVKRYRDRELGGVIKFVPALLLGLGIAVVAGVIYVAVWEVYLAATNYSFMQTYVATVLEAKKAEGLSGPALEELTQQMNAAMEAYKNPLFRMLITFSEIFPVGLIIAFISAGLLRNPKLLPVRA